MIIHINGTVDIRHTCSRFGLNPQRIKATLQSGQTGDFHNSADIVVIRHMTLILVQIGHKIKATLYKGQTEAVITANS